MMLVPEGYNQTTWLCLLQVEQQLRSNQGMGAADDIVVAQLEAENTQLRLVVCCSV